MGFPKWEQDKLLIPIQFISSILFFTKDKIIKKSEKFNVVPDFFLIKNLEKKEINITIKENIMKP